MKNIGLLIGSSLLSAFLAVFVYRHFEEPTQVVIREEVKPIYANYKSNGIESVPGTTTQPIQFSSSAPTDFISAAESVTPAVVNIKASSSGEYDIWGGYGGSSGSGVIISKDGLVVTNNHVIEDSDDLEITLSDKRKFKAELIGADENTDLALLRIKGENLPWLPLGNSDSIRTGEWVLAVGNPFNLESTVTAGIVSAKGRSIDILEGEYKIESFIQTDAAVNPGNSGGALVNTVGQLIGINTAIITRSGRYEGYSFAIPINLANKIINDLHDFGVVQRGILGVGIDEITDKKAKELGLSTVEGVVISRITPKSGADDAGLKRGDVILSINEVKTSTIPALQEQVARFRPGNKVNVQYFRSGKTYSTNVVLKNKSNTTDLVGAGPDHSLLKDLGFEIRNLTDSEQSKLNTKGVMVVSVYRGSTIERTNMDPNFVITKINDIAVGNIDDVVGALKNATGKVMLEGVYEEYNGEYYYAFKVDDK